jgi:hypothetical protein
MVVVLAVLGSWLATLAVAQDTQSPSPIDAINTSRVDRALAPLARDERLDTLAQTYLERILARRCPCALLDELPESLLLRDVAAILWMQPDTIHHTGLIVSYDLSVDRAIGAALGRPTASAVLHDRRLTLAGIASTVIAPESSWLAPPVDGVGREIDLTGFTLVVVITAGEQA